MAQLNRINLVGVIQGFVGGTFIYHERLASDDGAAPRSEERNKGGEGRDLPVVFSFTMLDHWHAHYRFLYFDIEFW